MPLEPTALTSVVFASVRGPRLSRGVRLVGSDSVDPAGCLLYARFHGHYVRACSTAKARRARAAS